MNYTKESKHTYTNIELINYLPNIGIGNVKEEIFTGLKAETKYISSKFFYDGKGSELFEQITHLDEYYPTRTEKKIISSITEKLAIDFKNLNIVELGSGDASKIGLLLRKIPENVLKTINYFPVDISQSAIEKSVKDLLDEFPLNNITGIVIDFFHQLKLIPNKGRRLFCFFGSTIGNFTPKQAEEFMHLLGNAMQTGDSLLLGMDMIKDLHVLEAAYNDKKGITAQFNKNILSVVNNLSDTDFNASNFEHYAFFNTKKSRIEMHLKALKNLEIALGSENKKIHMEQGETIHTENSHKFNTADIETMGTWAGIEIKKILTDDHNWFSLVYYKKMI